MNAGPNSHIHDALDALDRGRPVAGTPLGSQLDASGFPVALVEHIHSTDIED